MGSRKGRGKIAQELLAYLLTEHEVGFSGHEGTWHNG